MDQYPVAPLRVRAPHLVGLALIISTVAFSQAVNSWTNSVSGNWEDLKWSLGTRPSTNQSVMITNANWKAVGIGPATTTSFPGSLTISNLVVSAPPGDASTLLLNSADTAVPLRVLDGLTIGTNGTLMNLSSGVLVGSNGLSVAGGQVVQSGGFLHATNGLSKLDGTYRCTNGVLRAVKLNVGNYRAGAFTQVGGQVTLGIISLGSFNYSTQFVTGSYQMFDGDFTSDQSLVGGPGAFTQDAGTNRTRLLNLGSAYTMYQDVEYRGVFSLNGGALFADTVGLGLQIYGAADFVQTGGLAFVTNALNLRGHGGYSASDHGKASSYRNNGGTLVAQKVDAQEYSSFEQTAGQAFISDSLAGHGKFTSWGHETLLSLSGGFLGCSNLVCSAADFTQTGGTLWVTNVMSVSGNYCGGGDYSCSATYSCTNGNLIANAMQVLGRFMFAGGVASIANSVGFVGSPTFGLVVQNSFSGGILTCANMTSAFRDLTISGSTVVVSNLLSFSGLIANYGLPPPAGYASLSISAGSLTASNISIAASMYIHTGTGRITNAGVFYLSGYLSTTDASERLGRFSLQAGSQPGFVSISFGGTTNRLSFNDSSSQTWSAGETLFLKSWSGSTNGGGDDQLKFGTTAGGLTAAQLAQIQFIDPAGFAPGTYNAKILNTGEVVPTILPLLYPATGTGKIILTWSNATVLQTATNVAGPYLDIPGATSPYTNPIAGDKQRYFRLRQ